MLRYDRQPCTLSEIIMANVIIFITKHKDGHFITTSITDTDALYGVRWLSGEGVGLVILRLPDRFPAVPNDVVSLG